MNQMRPGQKNRNQRNKSGRKPMGNVVNRVYESAGPEGKVRGTPQQIIEKYLLLARDSQTSGDRVMAENFLQHAEHYIRLLGASQPQGAEQRYNGSGDSRQLQGRADYEDRDDDDDGDEEGGAAEPSRAQGDDRAPRDDQHAPQAREHAPRDERQPREQQSREHQSREHQPREHQPREQRDDRQPRRDPRDQHPRRDRDDRGGQARAPRHDDAGGRPQPVAASPLDTIDPADDFEAGPVATPESRAAEQPNPEPRDAAPAEAARAVPAHAEPRHAAPAPLAAVPAPAVETSGAADSAPATQHAVAAETPAPPADAAAEAPPAPRRRGRPRKIVAAEGDSAADPAEPSPAGADPAG